MHRLVPALVISLVVATTFPPTAALAQDSTAPVAAEPPAEDARALFQRGQQAYAQGDYDAAVEMWVRAYELDARPLLQFNLSQAYERLGRIDDAIASLQLYLDHADPTDEHQADARARSASLRERVARTGVRVTGGPEGATILVDGEDRGRTPRPDPIQVSPGSHRIVVSLAGRTDFHSTVSVPAGETIEVAIEMDGAAGASAGGEFPIGPVVLFSVGGAAIVVGAILGGVALGQAGSAPGRTSPEADSARSLALGADILIPLGAACAIAGLVWLLIAPSGAATQSEEAAASASVSPWAGPESAGISVDGRF